MNAKKFVARTSKEALSQIRLELGPDAVILSNRKVAAGIEIVALAGADLSRLTEMQTQNKVVVAPQPKKVAAPMAGLAAMQAARAANKAAPVVQTPAPVAKQAQPEQIVAPGMIEQQQGILTEIKSMRSMLQEQLACIAWSEVNKNSPERAKLLRELLNSGFSPELSRQLLDRMPDDAPKSWVKQVIGHNLKTVRQEDSIITRGGIYALVGPTGVGKTTTAAKLAARAVVRYGASKVALVSSDSYRIGAHEQLGIYAKMLGVVVHQARDANELRHVLSKLRDKHLVLIDTMGMGQRDTRVAEQAKMYDACGVRRLLMLNAASSGETLEEVARKYRSMGVIGCILTKLDEAVTLGSSLDVALRHKLSLHYLTNGQRVPEDIHDVNMEYLLHRALKQGVQAEAFVLDELELPPLMAAGGMMPRTQAGI